MVRNYKKKSSRGQWNKSDMAIALMEIKNGRMNCLAAANAFFIPVTTLRRHLKKNDYEMPVHGGRGREVFNEEQLENLKNYITSMDKMCFGTTRQHCRRLVFDFAEQHEIPHPFNKVTMMAGEDWMANFLKKFKINLQTPEASPIGYSNLSIEKFFLNLKEIHEKYKLPASNIYNAAESGLFTVLNKPPEIFSPSRNKRVSKIASEGERMVTMISCINNEGYYLPPFLIFTRQQMLDGFVERAPPGTVAHCSDGWNNEKKFVLFLKHFNLHVKPTIKSPVLLLVDNLKVFISLESINFCKENHIIVVGFPPHSTHRLQPLDVSFFEPLKTYYTHGCDSVMSSYPGQVIPDKKIGELLSTAYFKASTVDNAVNGFKECGIELYNPLVFNDDD